MKPKQTVTKECKGTPAYIIQWYNENRETEENRL